LEPSEQESILTTRKARISLHSLGVALVIALLAPAVSLASQPAYEPNDSLQTAAGPLANNSKYEAAIETGNDVDDYYFYVTTPTTAQVTLTVTNLGPGFEGLEARIKDSHGDTVSTIDQSLYPEDYAVGAATLEAEKYFLQVNSEWGGFNVQYKFTTAGTDGTFGSYATIQANCAAAQAVVNSAQEAVTAAAAEQNAAKAHRQRAFARMRGVERHGSRRAIQKARHKAGHAQAAYKAATAALKQAERSYKGATTLESPWCFIPQ
jgi:hypothetical protein